MAGSLLDHALFANLVDNALRHSGSGARLALDVRRHGSRIAASVADTGPGIPAQFRDKVLHRFFRLERSRTTPGSGWGLSLCRPPGVQRHSVFFDRVAMSPKRHNATFQIAIQPPGSKGSSGAYRELGSIVPISARLFGDGFGERIK